MFWAPGESGWAGRGSTKLCPLSTLPTYLPVPVPAAGLLHFPSICCGLGRGTALVRFTSRQDASLGQEPPSLSTCGGDTVPLTHLWWHRVLPMGLLRYPAVLPGARGPGQRSALGLFPKVSSNQRSGLSQTSVGDRGGRFRRNFFFFKEHGKRKDQREWPEAMLEAMSPEKKKKASLCLGPALGALCLSFFLRVVGAGPRPPEEPVLADP